ncbi:hypothetical protein ACVILL_007501 [Bradyrhizobium sp. USDA 3364]
MTITKRATIINVDANLFTMADRLAEVERDGDRL